MNLYRLSFMMTLILIKSIKYIKSMHPWIYQLIVQFDHIDLAHVIDLFSKLVL